MQATNLSVFENIFENKEISMKHIALLGEKNSGKTELLKQIIASFLNSNKKVMLLHPQETFRSLTDSLNGVYVNVEEQLNATLLKDSRLVSINTKLLDFSRLLNLLQEDNSQWVVVQDNLDELVYNYEQNEFATQKIDFLHYLSEFGRVFGVYTLIAGQELKKITAITPSLQMILNSRNLMLLKQSHTSLKLLQKMKWLTDSQCAQVQQLTKYKAVLVQR
ncbi:DUF87 domain-containing protein (plasmid) [Aneurinibacillus sp. Ricciae_BoGa-3]|uniref:helicase HerA domain-containing protein n=1 Tax=Aneurinibacillus sp. Ricciae_BoGa-3 TaxID=3022697 RepID=UPI0023425B41|nr:DUF87 domain-containing protein [Aneurinibacillus sp. Ricciae_BoGa-3]WCK56976.1 DUF87 domain-containing protein [Aneurinibacillus sp. Ricciae_BoGa-3]